VYNSTVMRATPLLDDYALLAEERISELRSAGLLREDLFIDGAWVRAVDDRRLEVRDPASGRVVANVASASPEDVERAIESAERARHSWGATTATERADVLLAWYELLHKHEKQLSTLLTIEQGKPLGEARAEIAYSAAFVRWYAEEARRAYGEIIPTNRAGRRLLVLSQPVGVVAAITPWNFPALMIARKVAPAIAAGCSVVVKPASETPLTAHALAELGARAGLPAGVLNVVHGDPVVVGAVLSSSSLIRMLSFTGSTEVGKLLMTQCAGTVKRLALELGGNAPFIVFDDADLDRAVQGALDAKFRNAGQTCVCANRLLVQANVHDVFVERFSEAVSKMTVGHGLNSAAEIGPLISGAALAKVENHLADAIAGGARVVTGGTRHVLGGTFFSPTVLVGASPTMDLASEETFGPVAPFFRFETEDEAIEMANSTESGLAAYFYTKDLGRAFRVGEALEFGVVGVNTGTISYEGAPFGGVKGSGLGREGSRHGLGEFLEIKYLCVDGL